jgi:hypothetical protein
MNASHSKFSFIFHVCKSCNVWLKSHMRHVVIFKYKRGATEDQVRQVTDAFRELKSKIPGIVSSMA